jgi:hypothetical protein
MHKPERTTMEADPGPPQPAAPGTQPRPWSVLILLSVVAVH